MAKVRIRGDRLTLVLPARIQEQTGVRDGDELEVSAEDGRIVLTRIAEPPLPGELGALDEAEAEFAQQRTHRLEDVLRGLGRKAQ